jgi:hypothetical protein
MTTSVNEATAAWYERQIWWQEEVDRQVQKMAGWKPIHSWRGVFLEDLPPERKRAIAAGIEHAIEVALQADGSTSSSRDQSTCPLRQEQSSPRSQEI